MTDLPGATYRLQFHADFTFADATAIVPYLASLGISHVYASPLFAARPGSTHGYDVIDPTRLNPDLGTEADFNRLTGVLERHAMGMIVDIVPNHMATATENPWWHDVLANGKSSPYAKFFDIWWDQEDDKLVLPVLGAPLDQAIAEGRVRRAGNTVRVYGKSYPLASGTPDGPLEAALAHQHYRLVFWRDELPNYRRFFEINDLIGMRVEDPDVFDATHAFALSLLADKRIDGLRIDHIDGLRDPLTYLRRLRERAGNDAYLVVEKILGHDETLPADWPVDGTTGYDFLGMANGLFVDGTGLRSLTNTYRRFIDSNTPIDDTLYRRKHTILANNFPREMGRLTESFQRIADLDEPIARDAILDLSAALPVYRTYVTAEGISAADAAHVATAAKQANAVGAYVPAIERLHELILGAPSDPGALEFVLRWQQLTGPAMAKGLEDSTFYRYNRLISLNEVGGHAGSVTPAAFHRFARARAKRWPHAMSTTSTHDTKRSEDVRARLAGLSEEPRIWDTIVNDLSRTARAHGAPAIDANTEYHLWQAVIGCWPSSLSPLGSGTTEGSEAPAPDDLAPYHHRLTAYLRKAIREAAEHTTWHAPDEAYEASIANFATWLTTDTRAASVRSKIARYVHRLDATAYKRSIAQIALKLTLPGVPDVYQGQELWDYSFVDPDNRRPVEFAIRGALLADVRRTGRTLRELMRDPTDGRAKVFTTHRLLELRESSPELFASSSYIPLAQRDRTLIAFARHLSTTRTRSASSARHSREGGNPRRSPSALPRVTDSWLVVVIPRLFNAKPTQFDVALPVDAPTRWRDVLNGDTLRTRNGALPAAKALRAGLPLIAVPL